MSINKKTALVSAVLVTSVLLSGCGLFGGEEKKQIDPPKSVTYEKKSEAAAGKQAGTEKETASKTKTKEEAAKNTVMTELYLLDKNGYVVPQTLALPKTQGVANQAIEYLVKDGPVTEILPNGFQAVLPADTKASVNIKDGTATVNFSKEFQDYKAEDELKILQSVTWTLTQFDTVEKVTIKINGKELTEMPVNGTPISDGLNRKMGINLDATDVVDIANTKAVTVYFLGGNEDSYYYVPVTRRVSNKEGNNIEAAVNELIKGPSYASKLVSDFMADTKLLEKPKVENGKVTLNFNKSVIGSLKEKMVSDQLLTSLVLSLTEQQGIQSVSILVDGKSGLVNEKGKKLSEPVTRPENVNTGSF